MSAASRRHLARVASLPCSVCGVRGVECHHPRGHEFGTGQSMKASDYFAIPLCPKHHRTGGLGVAFHAGKKSWQENFGSQMDHLLKTLSLLGMTFDQAKEMR